MRRTLGTLTIGQAPRTDVAPVLEAALGKDVPCIHAGVLDGLTRTEIEARFGARQNSELLVSRLLDGSSVVVDKEAAEEEAARKVAGLEERGCNVILMLCTGSFHTLKTKSAWLIEPERLLSAAVPSLVGRKLAGVLVPLIEQAGTEGNKWSRLAQPPLYAASSPYTASNEEFADAARSLKEQGAEILLLDCIGYTLDHKATAVAATGLPTVVSSSLVAKIASEIV